MGDVSEYLKKVVIRETKSITSHALIINIGIITLFRTILVSISRSKFSNLSKNTQAAYYERSVNNFESRQKTTIPQI